MLPASEATQPVYRGGPPLASKVAQPPRSLDERGVLRVGMLLTAAFVATALVAYAVPAIGTGHWAGLHLALAGAALVAVGT